MMDIIECFKRHFSREFREEQWQKELDEIQEDIKMISNEISGGKELFNKIEEKVVDRGSSFHNERRQGRMDEINHNRQLLVKRYNREKILKRKLCIP